MTPPVLPRSLTPIPGESLTGFLLRLSHRLALAPGELAALTALEPRGRLSSSRLLRLDPDGGFAHATRLAPAEAEALTLTPLARAYPAARLEYCGRQRTLTGLFVKENWIFSAATRYCPQCLAGDGSAIQNVHGGGWQRTWRLPVVFACLRHRRLLRLACPACARPAHAKTQDGLLPAPTVLGLHPAACRARVTWRGACCGHRLDTADPAPELTGAALALQQRTWRLLHTAADPDTGTAGGPGQYFNDLRVLSCLTAASWPVGAQYCDDSHARDLVDRHIEAVRASITATRLAGRAVHELELYDRPPLEPAACAALLSAADRLARQHDPAERTAIMHHLLTAMPPSAKAALWLRQFRRGGNCTPQLTASISAAFAPRSFHAPLPRARPAFSADHIPAIVPLTWYETHLTGLAGLRTMMVRRAAALRLAILATRADIDGAARAIGMPGVVAHATVCELGRRRTALEAAVDQLAAVLGATAPALTDYGRRRRALAGWMIPPDEWELLTADLVAADTHRAYSERPTDWGETKRRAASASVWAQLTGGEARHAPAFDPAPVYTQPVSLVGATSSQRYALKHRDYGHYAALRARLADYAEKLTAVIDARDTVIPNTHDADQQEPRQHIRAGKAWHRYLRPMTGDALQRLTKRESDTAWERFDQAFGFHPSTCEFPAITEPNDSITWSLDAIRDGDREKNIERLTTLVQDALTACTPQPDGSLLILDWQHEAYRLRPHHPPTEMFLPNALTQSLRPGWPLGPYPNGDYYILLAEDLGFGSFGHPWEHSLCLFGTDLLAAVADEITSLLPRIQRRGGRPAAPPDEKLA